VLPVVIDADRATVETDPLFAMGTHVIFSGECLRNTVGTDDLAAGLARMAQFTDAFLAVSNGALPVLWRENQAIREMPVFPVAALDTLGAGDVFHGAFTLALAEGCGIAQAMRFAAATAGIKCTRFGGSTGAGAPRSRRCWRGPGVVDFTHDVGGKVCSIRDHARPLL
jgi:sulfofructose kinase